MAKPYSEDLRERVLRRIACGQSCRAAARELDVSASFSIKLKARHGRTGLLAPEPMGRPRGTGKLDAHRDFLIEQVEKKPDITMPELADALFKVRGATANPASLSRFLCKIGFSYKKDSSGSGTRTR